MGHKYSKAICERDHAGEIPRHVLDSLPEYQGHPVRHRCAACAYEAGLNEAAEDIKKLVDQVKVLTLGRGGRLDEANDSYGGEPADRRAPISPAAGDERKSQPRP